MKAAILKMRCRGYDSVEQVCVDETLVIIKEYENLGTSPMLTQDQ